jgi:hypothetical protein
MKIPAPNNYIDYTLTETRSQLVKYSQMADNKANILLSMSAVLATLAAAKLADPVWIVPTIVLIAFLMASVFLSLLAVIPSLRLVRRPTKLSTRDPNFNTLFFADYSQVTYEEYLAHMEEVLSDPGRAYEAQVREIHSAGKYLHATKFRYIKYGYIVFFIGLISSILIRVLEVFVAAS